MKNGTSDDKAGNERGKRGLIVLDMTTERAAIDGALRGEVAAMLPFINGELKYFRERGRPVVFVQPQSEHVVSALTPRRDERVIARTARSAFFETPLAAHLRKEGCGRATIVGLGAASGVVLSAADAIAHGFGVSVPEPCVYDVSESDKASALHLLFDVWGAQAQTTGNHASAR